LIVINDRSPKRSVTKRMAHQQLAVIDQQLQELRLARPMMQAATECICHSVEVCTCGAMDEVLDELRDRLG